MIRSGMSPPRWDLSAARWAPMNRSRFSGLMACVDPIRRLSHRVEADESSNLVCYSLDRVVERKARMPRSHVEQKRAAIRIHRAKRGSPSMPSSASLGMPPEPPAVHGSLPGDDETASLPSLVSKLPPLAASKPH